MCVPLSFLFDANNIMGNECCSSSVSYLMWRRSWILFHHHWLFNQVWWWTVTADRIWNLEATTATRGQPMYSTCCLLFVLLPCWKKEEDFLFIFAFFFSSTKCLCLLIQCSRDACDKHCVTTCPVAHRLHVVRWECFAPYPHFACQNGVLQF